jgi:hypothetical protein
MGKCVPILYYIGLNFVNVEGAQESIPPAYVAWRAGTTTLYVVPVRRRNRFIEIYSWAQYETCWRKDVTCTVKRRLRFSD